ncbi:hypothetical protein ZWY2020_002763 [Hordeum vulgare]|nr:hypothetical protein ZWY2020_002763 [Hordeum vulgare]
MEVENRYVAVRHHVEGPRRWTTSGEERRRCGGRRVRQVLVRNMYVSIDPYQLNRMKRQSASTTPSTSSCPARIASYGAGEVVASACEEYKEGDVVTGLLAWEVQRVRPAPGIFMSKVDASSGFPLSYQMGY